MTKTPQGRTVTNWRELFNAANEAIFIYEAATGRVLDMNDRVEEIFGYSRAEVLGMAAADGLPGGCAPFGDAAVALIHKAAGEGPQIVEWQARRKNGELFWCEISMRGIARTRPRLVLAVVRDITRRRRIEEQLSFQSMLLDQISDTVTATDLEGRITYANQAQCLAVGASRDELVGKFVHCFGDNASRGATQDQIIEGTRANGYWRGEVVNRDSEGREFTMDCRTTMIRDAAGLPIGMCGVGTDITDRMRLEQKLEDNMAQLEAIFEAEPECVKIVSSDGRLLEMNLAGLKMLDAECLAQVQSRPLVEFVAAEYRAAFVELHGRVMQGESGMLEFEAVGLKGRRCWLETHAVPLKDPSTGGTNLLGVTRDVTSRRRAEQQLRDSEKLYRSLFDLSPSGIVLEDTSGNILEVNPAMCRIFGYAPEEMRGRHVHLLVPPELQAAVNEHLAHLRAGEKLLHEVDNIAKDGQPHRVEIHEMTVPLPDGRQGILAVVNDISDRRKLEEQLRHLQKMESVGQLAAGVAHDFNNILTVINGSSSILSELLAGRPECLEWVNHIVAAGDRAANLTRQLLLFSRKQQMQTRSLSLNELTSNLTKMLGRVLGEDITLEFSYDNDLPPVQGDPGMLEQVIMNLAVNARDAMPDGGRLHIATSTVNFTSVPAPANPQGREGKFVRLTIRDTGCGIPLEIQDRIFEPFFTTKEVGKGTGLGLATVFGIIAQHDGWIEVDSKLGQGTVFSIYLPPGNDPGARVKSRTESAGESGHGELILVVEDDLPVRDLIFHALTRQGYRVLVAESGARAMELSREQMEKVALLVTDLVMPGGVNGRELADSLRKSYPNLRAIYCSGYSPEIAGGRLALEQGVNFLQKPFTPGELLDAVAERLR